MVSHGLTTSKSLTIVPRDTLGVNLNLSLINNFNPHGIALDLSLTGT